jgi:hypothetical protein
MDAGLEARGHHSQWIVNAILIVDNEFLRQQMQDFTIAGQWNGAGLVYRGPYFFAADLPRASSEADASMAVDPAYVRTRNSDIRVFNGRACGIFRLLDRLLDRSDCLVEIDYDALAGTSRFSRAMAAITNSTISDLGH